MEILFAFFLVGYFVLSGFDIGVGMLLPLLGRGAGPAGAGPRARAWVGSRDGTGPGARTEVGVRVAVGAASGAQTRAAPRAGAAPPLTGARPGSQPPGTDRNRRLVLATIAPFFLANEVWLVGAVGLAVGAFPGREAALFGRLTPAVVTLVIAWIVRDMGLWLRGRLDSARWRLCCDTAIVAGSWTIAVCWGTAIGILLGGGYLVALTIIALCCAFAAHGALFATLRLPAPPLFVSRRAARSLLPVTAVVMVALALLGISALPGGVTSAHSTQTLLTVVLVPLLPLMLAAQAWVWWTFRSRVQGPSYL